MMSETTMSRGDKLIVFLATIPLIYTVFYYLLFSSILTGLLILVFATTLLLHLYYGYTWAKIVLALFSLIFAVILFLTLHNNLANINLFLLVALCIFLSFNSYFLIFSKNLSRFLDQQKSNLNKNTLTQLRVSRWILYLLIIFVLILDLTRL